MNQPIHDFDSQLPSLASRQLADYDAHNPGRLFDHDVVLSVAQAYALQSAVAELRRLRGERTIGYKVGCTSSAIRAQLAIDHCIAGRLFESEQHASGVQLSRSAFANLAIEGELAIELSREPTENDVSGDGIPSCLSRVFPVIELHHHVMRGERPSAGELIANNAIHGGFVAGNAGRLEDVLPNLSLSIYADDRLLEECSGTPLIHTIRTSLKWLMDFVGQQGERLRAGQIILTGSIPSLIPIHDPCRLRVVAPPLGSVEATIV